MLAARDALFAELQQFRQDADADLAAALQQELAGATERYQALKTAAGALDFADLLARARELIRPTRECGGTCSRSSRGSSSTSSRTPIRFRRRFCCCSRPTIPTRSTTADRSPLTPASCSSSAIRSRRSIASAAPTSRPTGASSSRSRSAAGACCSSRRAIAACPQIQRFVNAAFAREMKADAARCRPATCRWRSRARPTTSQPAVVALPVPEAVRPQRTAAASARAIDESLPDAVGAFIAWLVDRENGWTVAERRPDGSRARVPIQPRHIAVLFRRFVSFGDDVTRAYTDAIEARGVPHLLVGGKAFHGREEVETIRAALAAIEWPDDELSVFATLKGSLFAIDDEQLLEFRHRFGAVHPFRIPKELGGNSGQDLALTGEPTAQLMPIAEALRLLQQLHRGRNYRPVADTVTRLLERTRAHVGFILRPAGEQALANVLHVAELARQYEASGGISFRGFIDDLRAAAESESAEAPILEESSDGVRLMTVHKAKGLEFPVVILADLTCRISRGDASRYLEPAQGLCAMKIGGWAPHELYQHEAEEVARDQAEGVRLAYVAATRARDLLVVPALGDEPWDGGWFGPLNSALYPPREARRTAVRGPGCPAFKSKDSVAERPGEEPAGTSTMCPGRHAFTEGYSVVWWEPGAGGGLSLGAKASFGVRREDLIVKDVPRHVIADGRTHYDRWRLARDDARASGAIPTALLTTAREWAAESGPGSHLGLPLPSVVVIDLAAEGERVMSRPRGPAFGTLVHDVLANMPFDAGFDEAQRIAALHARLRGMSAAEAVEATAVARRVFAHDLLVRARSAAARGVCRRETPVTCTTPDGRLIEGVVDLAFEEAGHWNVVDYKTDRDPLSADAPLYQRQVALYAAAIARATGQPATASIILA